MNVLTVMSPAPTPTTVRYVYYVAKWGNHQEGYTFDLSTGGFHNRAVYNRMGELFGNAIPIPIDPMTAVSLGLVTPEEINMPEGLRAAFNLLK